ncbi:MAG: J domain-containing protein [Phycisphaerales bacterium]|nr:J domain-containing protein [Phycisphaerales bacterium]
MAQSKRDYYDVLGLKRSATPEEIKRAYRKLARELHPDVSKAPDAEKRFNEVNEAYETLSDPEKREKYDQFGHAGGGRDPFGGTGSGGGSRRAHYTWSNIGGRPGPGNIGADDIGAIFEDMFGGSMQDSPFAAPPRSATRQRAKPRDLEHELTVSFMTAVQGGTEQVKLTYDGESKTLDVTIPPGVAEGQKLRVRQAVGGLDMIITVHVGKHPYFYREDGKPLDLLIDVPITVAEAALGANVAVPLLKGSIELTIPPGTSSDKRLRIKDRGIAPKDGKPGHLYVVVKVVPPTKLDKEAESLVRSLAKHLDNPRKGAPWE